MELKVKQNLGWGVEFDVDLFKRKLNAIIHFEISMGLVRSKRAFAKKYGITPQKLNYYLTTGGLNVIFLGRVCEKHNLTLDYLIHDKRPDQSTAKEFLPPLILPPKDSK